MFKLTEYVKDENIKSSIRLYEYESPKVDVYENIIAELVKNDPMSVLEIGCGNGEFLCRLRESYYNGPLTGIDASPELIAKANDKGKEKKIYFKVMDAHNLSFIDNTYDIIVSNFTLHTLTNISQALDEVYRCLKPDGLFFGAIHGNDHLPKRRKYLQLALELLPDTQAVNSIERVTIGNLSAFLQKFDSTTTNSFRSEIRLEDPSIYIEYFNNLKEFVFNPIPKKKQWGKVLEMVEQKVMEEVKQQGYFLETTHVGYFKTQKPL